MASDIPKLANLLLVPNYPLFMSDTFVKALVCFQRPLDAIILL